MKEQSFTTPATETVVKEEPKTKITLNSREAETLDFLKDEYLNNKNEKQINLSINVNSVASLDEKSEVSEIETITEKIIEEKKVKEEKPVPDTYIPVGDIKIQFSSSREDIMSDIDSVMLHGLNPAEPHIEFLEFNHLAELETHIWID